MAIDSTLFAADIPAGTYAIGDTVTLGAVAGPAVVRSGYGTPILKEVVTGTLISANGSYALCDVKVQNSSWIDPVINGPGYLTDVTFLADGSTAVQYGNDIELQPNSTWIVTATFKQASTITGANSVFALIDIEYPAVAGVVSPQNEHGFPTSIENVYSVTPGAMGAMLTKTWETFNVDQLKAGFKYLMQKVSIQGEGSAVYGFVRFSNAAGMGGLARIVPVAGNQAAICKTIKYASVETKGPMDIGFLLFSTNTASTNVSLVLDYVKKV